MHDGRRIKGRKNTKNVPQERYAQEVTKSITVEMVSLGTENAIVNGSKLR